MVQTFPMNTWYAAAWDVDIKRALFPRTICGKHVVMYRQADGQVTALEDACWHRLVPLSKGRLDGDSVVCGYHGLKYNSSGRCTFMPSQETINPSACVRAYPVVERHRFIWLWMGDPAMADPALVPDMHWNDDPAWAGDGKTIHVKCDYRLVVDNLMDLTHETFVHGGSIGNEAVAEAPFDVTHGDTEPDGCGASKRRHSGPDNYRSRDWSIAGRSFISRRPAPSISMSGSRRPAPARRKAIARMASTAMCSIP